MGGYSAQASPSITTESPMRVSAWATAPSGRFMAGKVSTAPKARRRNIITRSTCSFTRYGVTFRYPVGILGTIAGSSLAASFEVYASTGHDRSHLTTRGYTGGQKNIEVFPRIGIVRGFPRSEARDSLTRGLRMRTNAHDPL